MFTVDPAEAKARLVELLNKVEANREVVITRRGKPATHLSHTANPKKPLPLGSLAEFRKGMPPLRHPAAELLREARDEERGALKPAAGYHAARGASRSLMPKEIKMTREDELLKRITTNPGIFGGKPIIRGLRFAVEHVLQHLAAGETVEGLLYNYSILELDDIRACLLFADRLRAGEQGHDHTLGRAAS